MGPVATVPKITGYKPPLARSLAESKVETFEVLSTSEPDITGVVSEWRRCLVHRNEYEHRYHADGFGQAYSGCPTCADEKKARERAEYEEHQREKLCRHYRAHSGVPRRFETATLDNYEATSEPQKLALKIARGFVDKFQDLSETGASLIFCGTPGTGKTHLGCAIAKAVIGQARSAYVTTSYDMLRTIKSTWNRESKHTEEDMVLALVQKDLLVIDEIGIAHGSESERILMFNVLDGRYQEMKSTVLISNFDRAGLLDHLGPRLMDRMTEQGGALVVFDWPSYRQSGSQRQPPSATGTNTRPSPVAQVPSESPADIVRRELLYD